MNEKKICQLCVLPESPPYITIGSDGICSVCRDFQQSRKSAPPVLETELVRIFNKYRGKGKYDCLVMCSGGKDSTSSLYYVKEKYRLNPLAFTFDHGFETEGALCNIRNAVNILGVEWFLFKSDYMHEMFRKIVLTDSGASICHLCSIWYMQLTFDLAARFEIPLIIAGWTKGQTTSESPGSKCNCTENAPEFRTMAEETQKFLKNMLPQMPAYRNFPASMEELLKKAEKRHRAMVISPHWFLNSDSSEYTAVIQEKLNWKHPELSYPAKSTNCLLNFLSVEMTLKHFGYTHYHVEMSKLIRMNLMTRKEAQELLKINYDRTLIEEIKKKLKAI